MFGANATEGTQSQIRVKLTFAAKEAVLIAGAGWKRVQNDQVSQGFAVTEV